MKYLFSILVLIVCSTINAKTVELDDWTIRVISDYIFEYESCHEESPGTIIVSCTEDMHHYYMYIYEGKTYYDKVDLSGTICCGHPVKFVGTNIPFLFQGKISKRIDYENATIPVGYDPIPWKMVFHKDGSLCKMFTWKVNPGEDIDDMIDLSLDYKGYSVKRFDLRHTYSEFETFNFHDPEILNGEMKLAELMLSYIGETGICDLTSPSIIDALSKVDILVKIKRNGKMRIIGFEEKSGDRRIDSSVMKAARKIAKSHFKPFTFRGEKIAMYKPLTRCLFRYISGMEKDF